MIEEILKSEENLEELIEFQENDIKKLLVIN